MVVAARVFGLVFAVSALVACSAPAPPPPASAASVREPTLPKVAETTDRKDVGPQWQLAKDVFDRRCVVCHGCYDAPCQLVMSSFEGIERGASKQVVYDGARLLATEPTRLFIDARSVQDWRKRDFHPVLPEGATEDPSASLLVRMLELKRQHPLPARERLPEGFTLGIDREQECPSTDELDGFVEEHPLWGMPYALPGLSDDEHQLLVDWVQRGAPRVKPPALGPELRDAVRRWEDFFNDPLPKSRLVARYIYEHLFLASLYFEELDQHTFFRLVRSRTPSGTPIDEIATRRPFDDPGDKQFYYRLAPQHATVLEKTHMPYALSDARLARYRELFIAPKYDPGPLPSYDPELSANPFAAFRALPVRARYRFMLEEAQFTMMGFIKGPVCRGQVALDVIEDRFWISFVDPESPVLEHEAAFLADAAEHLDLPAEHGSNGHLLTWLKYARSQKKYLEKKSEFLRKLAKTPEQVTLSVVWDGDHKNPNAALTVMRHFDSATVVKGFVGGHPKTAWVVGYALLERIHYLLVAGFDVFGNVGHQLTTRMYMDFLRMEAEHNFLALLPKRRRRALVDAWYEDVRGKVKDEVYGKVARFDQETGIPFHTNTPEHELYDLLRKRMEPVLDQQYALERLEQPELRSALERLDATKGRAASLLPETSFLELRNGNEAPLYFTLLRDSAHTNVAQLFGETDRRKKDRDELTVLRGFVGAYPNALFSVERAELTAFVDAVYALEDEASYASLHTRFGVRRTSAHFWETSDRFHEAYRKLSPLEAGLFDYNRLDDR